MIPVECRLEKKNPVGNYHLKNPPVDSSPASNNFQAFQQPEKEKKEKISGLGGEKK